jgi:hypothetical protein
MLHFDSLMLNRLTTCCLGFVVLRCLLPNCKLRAAAAAAAAGDSSAADWDWGSAQPGTQPMPGRAPRRTRASSPAWRCATELGGGDGGGDEDDVWADRLWHDMQEHRHRAAAAAAAERATRLGGARTVPPTRDVRGAASERAARAAAAAAESERILKEEQAKDADWRAAMMRQVQEVCFGDL